MTIQHILERMQELGDPGAAEGMARYGITARYVYGLSIPQLRKMAKETGRDQKLSLSLWEHVSRETRILASMIGKPDEVSEIQMDTWAGDFDSWEICDQAVMNLFEKTPFSYKKALEWYKRDEEFVRRAGFVLMARLAVSDKQAGDEQFIPFLPCIREKSHDDRNYVKKGINWALRQIGKRNSHLNGVAVKLAEEISLMDSKSAKWIAADALRELKSEAVLLRLRHREGKTNERKTDDEE